MIVRFRRSIAAALVAMLALLLLAVPSLGRAAAISLPEAEQLYQRGNSAWQRNERTAALQLWQQVSDSGLLADNLFANLTAGNRLAGNHGAAVFHAHRWRLLGTQHTQAVAALRAAEQAGNVPADYRWQPSRTAALARAPWLWVLLAAGGAGLGALAYLGVGWARAPSQPRSRFNLGSLALGIAVVAAVGVGVWVLAVASGGAGPHQAVVNASAGTSAHAGPGTNYAIAAQLAAGSLLNLRRAAAPSADVQETAGWIEVELHGGADEPAWVKKDALGFL